MFEPPRDSLDRLSPSQQSPQTLDNKSFSQFERRVVGNRLLERRQKLRGPVEIASQPSHLGHRQQALPSDPFVARPRRERQQPLICRDKRAGSIRALGRQTCLSQPSDSQSVSNLLSQRPPLERRELIGCVFSFRPSRGCRHAERLVQRRESFDRRIDDRHPSRSEIILVGQQLGLSEQPVGSAEVDQRQLRLEQFAAWRRLRASKMLDQHSRGPLPQIVLLGPDRVPGVSGVRSRELQDQVASLTLAR